MRKIETQTTDIEIVICDICGGQERPMGTCIICNKDMCTGYHCGKPYFIHPIYGDYGDDSCMWMVCKYCQPELNKYEDRLQNLRHNHTQQLKQIESEIIHRVKDNVIQTKHYDEETQQWTYEPKDINEVHNKHKTVYYIDTEKNIWMSGDCDNFHYARHEGFYEKHTDRVEESVWTYRRSNVDPTWKQISRPKAMDIIGRLRVLDRLAQAQELDMRY